MPQQLIAQRHDNHASTRAAQLEALASGYTPAQRAFESLCLLAFVALLAALLQKIGLAITAQRAPVAAAAFVAAFFLADFASGLIHWVADTWGTVDWPILGKALIRPFREHHLDQTAITRHDFVETNGAVALVAIPFLVAALALPMAPPLGFTVACFLAFMCLWGCPTSQIHKWAHQNDVPAVVAWLQRRGAILSAEHHRLHHTAPFDEAYCITSGILNGPLRRLRFFRRAEALITRITGAVPREDDQRLLSL